MLCMKKSKRIIKSNYSSFYPVQSCSTVVIGNGTACRETEAYFADLIMKKYFAPLDVVYW